MVRKIIVLLGVTAFAGLGARAIAGDGCAGATASAESKDKFADGKGQVFGVELSSQKLFDSLTGLSVEEDKIQCPGCSKAYKNQGRCEHCKVFAANGKFYKSPVSYALAKGTPVTAEMMASSSHKCPECETAHKENGRCEHCKVSFVAGRLFKSEDAYKVALAAYDLLKRAVKAVSSCEDCAVAMVMDGKCADCKVKFENGKMIADKG